MKEIVGEREQEKKGRKIGMGNKRAKGQWEGDTRDGWEQGARRILTRDKDTKE